MPGGHRIGGISRVLALELFAKIYGELMQWRLDPYIRALRSGRKERDVFPFARGLRFSANLIYVIREVLSGTGLTANWGQIIDTTDDITSLSKECDIIIHKDGHFRRWNGDETPIMDFRFIDRVNASAVISCKSFIKPSSVEIEYPTTMGDYVGEIWLFAECCGPRSPGNIETKAKEVGYGEFWYLYTWSQKYGVNPDEEGWLSFISRISDLD